MAILLNNNGFDNACWKAVLSDLLTEERIVLMDDTFANDEIEFALVWDHPLGDLKNYPNLRAIMMLGAGTEHIDQEIQLPSVPVVRLIDPAVVSDMCAYSLYWVMHFHRSFEVYRQQQKQSQWLRHDYLPACNYHVTVLGLGQIGLKVAEQLAQNGYKVSGWDQQVKKHDAIQCFHGDKQIATALENTHVLINCLPQTAETKHFINQQILDLMPPGANLINISRGAVINDQDLLNSLEQQQISTAVLDAHCIEPLPETSPYWQHPDVVVTPHIAGATYARSAAKVIVANIERIRKGEDPYPLHTPPCHKTGSCKHN